jgi:signal transduction histidine kinase
MHRLEIFSDRKRVFQCILNYLANAIKYTGKGWVSISAKKLNGEVEILIEDTGYGISEKEFPRVFQSFERLNSSLLAKEPGSGLGLYLTRKIASEMLGGSVRVESRLGVGSRFFLNVLMHRPSQEYDNKISSPEGN